MLFRTKNRKMKKKILTLVALSVFSGMTAKGEEVLDSIRVYGLEEVSVTSLLRNNITTGSIIGPELLLKKNHGQGPDYVFSELPSVYAYNDNGTRMGYTYFKIRGMGQERMNVTLDGMPWNELEDFGCYLSNAPDLMSSMHSIKLERGASVTGSGAAAYAGNITLESVNLREDTTSYVSVGGGSFGSFRTSVVYNSGVSDKGWGFHVRATQQQTDGYKTGCFNNAQGLSGKVGYFFNSNHSIDLFTILGYHRNGQGYLGVPESLLPDHPTPFKQTVSGNKPQETDNFLTGYTRLQYKGVLSDKVILTSSLYWSTQKGDYRVGWEEEERGYVLNNYDLSYHLYGTGTTVKYYPTESLSLTSGVNLWMYQRRHRGYDIPGDTLINHWREGNHKPYYDNTGYKPDLSGFMTVGWRCKSFEATGSIQLRYTGLHYRVSLPSQKGIDIDQDNEWTFLNYSLGLTWSPNTWNKIYARYSETSREPSRVDMFGAEYYQGEYLATPDNERVHDLEVGWELRTSRIKANINAFWMGFSNELVTTGELSATNGLPLHTQHNATRYGLEGTLEYNSRSGLCARLSGSVSKNKLKEFKTHTYSPGHTLFGEVWYNTKGGSVFGIHANERGEMWMDLENEHSLPVYFSLGAYYHQQVGKRFTLEIDLENITNRSNISNGSVDSGVAYYIPDAPFTFWIGGKIKL